MSGCPPSSSPPKLEHSLDQQADGAVDKSDHDTRHCSSQRRCDTAENHFSPGHYMLWRKLMRVCHYWRNVALATPSLWVNIDITKPIEFTSMCLERSQSAMLKIFIPDRKSNRKKLIKPRRSLNSPDLFDVFELLASHSDRIRSLRLPHPLLLDIGTLILYP
ncbi:hypothetical protein B0H21DRAFT_86234 [Amylocystis lapponica]|nr:hypothetical protein B0H21DRAFT_86234 [Amylocystis lapponica]